MLVSDSLHDWSRRRGYAPMQLRLMTRRLKMGARAIGQDGRSACLWTCDTTRDFLRKLSDRQAIQWWISTPTISRPSKAALGGIWFKSSDIKALIFGVACIGDQTVAGATGRRNAAVIE
jgi:hypothetical protein